MNGILVFLACMLPTITTAGVYKWVADDGSINYSDRPVEQAEDVKFPGSSATDPATGPTTDGAATTSAEGTRDDPQASSSLTGYTQFQILKPEENQIFRSDQGEVSVALLLEPTLDAEHEIRLSLDGKPIQGGFNSTQLVIRQVSRGSHSLRASIVNREGSTVASSNSVNFQVRRAASRPRFEQQ